MTNEGEDKAVPDLHYSADRLTISLSTKLSLSRIAEITEIFSHFACLAYIHRLFAPSTR